MNIAQLHVHAVVPVPNTMGSDTATAEASAIIPKTSVLPLPKIVTFQFTGYSDMHSFCNYTKFELRLRPVLPVPTGNTIIAQKRWDASLNQDHKITINERITCTIRQNQQYEIFIQAQSSCSDTDNSGAELFLAVV
jgi:hypothetical protein